jgi:hypothetical protein
MKLAMVAAASAAVVGIASGAHAAVVNLGPGDGWFVQDQNMNTGDFFNDSYLATATEAVRITDLFVVSDQFGVYVNGVHWFDTPAMADWNALGASGPFQSPPYLSDPNAAWASGLFSGATIVLKAGDVLSLTDIHIPPQDNGAPFPDGTVAVKAVPEPATWAMMLIGLGGLGAVLRRSRKGLAIA